MSDLDALLDELARLRLRIAELAPGDPHRTTLEDRRDSIHARARHAADRIRPADELRRELERIQERLAEIDRMPIDPSFTERRQERWPIGNPTGYIRKINAMIETQTDDERRQLVERVAELTALLSER